MAFNSPNQRKAAMARMGRNESKVINQLLTLPDTTIRTVKINGKPHLERRIVIGNKIILERVKIDGKK